MEEFYGIEHKNRGKLAKHISTDYRVRPESNMQSQRERINLAKAEEPTVGR